MDETDRYENFSELEQNEKAGEDYTILYREADSPITVMALHGGGIEPGTIDIADAVAGKDHTFYAFKGIKKRGNRVLHITSNRYDEPAGLKAAKDALIVISIHGCRDKSEMVFIGGKNQEFKERIVHALRCAGFAAQISALPGLRGISSENICNRCQSGEGVQLEISRGLREKMFDNIDRRSLRRRTRVFYDFVESIRSVLPSEIRASRGESEIKPW